MGRRFVVLIVLHGNNGAGITGNPRLEFVVFALNAQYFGMRVQHFLFELVYSPFFFGKLPAPTPKAHQACDTDDQHQKIRVNG
jgi:hypothetical protein